jgi:cysteinyl-tRNA synthetase
MSKSENNFFTIRDVLGKHIAIFSIFSYWVLLFWLLFRPLTVIFFQIISLYHPMALRYLLIRTHYRSDVNHSDKGIENASDRVYYIYKVLKWSSNIGLTQYPTQFVGFRN